MGFTLEKAVLCFRMIAYSILNIFSLPFLSHHSILFLYFLIFKKNLCFFFLFCVSSCACNSVCTLQCPSVSEESTSQILGCTMLCSILMPFWDGLLACILDHYISVYSLSKYLLAYHQRLLLVLSCYLIWASWLLWHRKEILFILQMRRLMLEG